MKKNILLFFSVLLVLYLTLESLFFYGFPRVFPANVNVLVEEGLQLFLQSSKRGVAPKHYIALFGDSYAQGMGDWATDVMAKPMARYHTAHLLQDATGKDVVTFGSAGAGSVRALVTEPISQLDYARRYSFRSLPGPDVVLVYFYEGNDLYDNARYFQYSFPALFDNGLQFDSAVYQRYLQTFSLERDATYRKAQRHDAMRYLPLAGMLQSVFRLFNGLPIPEDPDVDVSLDPPWLFGASTYKSPGVINHALINHKIIQLPDNLQGPALDMTDDQLRQSWFAFEQALIFSRAHFKRSHFVLVYIPSVLSMYDIQDETVSVQGYEGRKSSFALSDVRHSALLMQKHFHEVAASQGLPVIDTTEMLQAAARNQSLHGPEDWNHLNKKGYEVLTEAIMHNLDQQYLK